MSEVVAGGLFATAIFSGMLTLLEVGRRSRQRHRARYGAGAGAGLGPVEGAVFGLMSLLLAFAFSGAASRFDTRRMLIVDEANAISSAYLRLDLLEPEVRPALQQKFRDYVDARLALYHVLTDSQRVRTAQELVLVLQQEIWEQAVAAMRDAPVPTIAVQVVPAISAMTTAASSRVAASFIHPPLIVYLLLGMASLLSAVLAGYAMGASDSRNWLHILGFAAIFAVTFYVIIDLEYPRLGHFRIDEFDQLLVAARASMR